MKVVHVPDFNSSSFCLDNIMGYYDKRCGRKKIRFYEDSVSITKHVSIPTNQKIVIPFEHYKAGVEQFSKKIINDSMLIAFFSYIHLVKTSKFSE